MRTAIARWITAACAALGTLACGSVRAQDAPWPDVLLVMPDQMRGDCLSAVGHPVLRTRTIDALAARGVLFRRAYVTVPSCIPARFALLTGQFPQTSGVVGFKARPITVPTLPQLLADRGYTTVLVGRNMHQVPTEAAYGYGRRIHGSTYVDGDAYDRMLRAAVPEPAGIRALVADLGVTYNHWQAAPWPLDDAFHPTTWVVATAQDELASAPPDAPLFLTASFYAPHPPLFPPAELFEQFASADLPAPARGDWVDVGSLTPEGDRAGHRVLLEGDALRNAQAGYFGLIQQIDDEIGPLVDAFIARSEAAGRPWLVVLTSDHGEMLGDHGYFRKCEPYEGSANIPFVVAGSDELGFAAGHRSDAPVCLEDLMPTLLELAGAPTPAAIDGVSLVPVLRAARDEVRAWLHFEHATCYSVAQAFHALTDGRFKYVWRPADGSEQLFDLAHDPREEHDLAPIEAHREALARWRATLVRRLADRPEGFSDGEHLIAGRRYPPIFTPGERR